MNDLALELHEIGLRIGGAKILEEVSFGVAEGEMVGVIGPNGAGKTTLFNVISGLMQPTGGSLTMSGDDITRASVHGRARAGIGRTFQTSSVFPDLSALENVRIPAQIKLGGATSPWLFPRKHDRATAEARERLEEVGLDAHFETNAGVLSHGDKRKLEIAMLLATEPSVVLLDEPMAGVGSGDVPGLVEIIRTLHRSGRTVLMVEHHMEVLLGLVDRVAVMHHGKLLAIGTPDEITADPRVQEAYLGAAV
ncbi:ABC transporter ATP-binding protein [uncultured Agrococcus sp.]|uniref:ABC transporter ATP-binding protein n=1 Tax=uncultured Agrococcus sp. TaxID=382258 RepID=UPI0025F7B2A4|nr:ABC transporter ATP-binding protein [uncultured Agrococcus sp.]